MLLQSLFARSAPLSLSAASWVSLHSFSLRDTTHGLLVFAWVYLLFTGVHLRGAWYSSTRDLAASSPVNVCVQMFACERMIIQLSKPKVAHSELVFEIKYLKLMLLWIKTYIFGCTVIWYLTLTISSVLWKCKGIVFLAKSYITILCFCVLTVEAWTERWLA